MRPATVNRTSVLVVDDSNIVRQRLCELLNEDDCIQVVAEAAGVEEAWRLFEQHRPDAAVLDLRLPDGGGLGLLSRIKQTSPSCLVIVLTHFRELIFRHESRRCGADYFLHKATEFERVVDLLHNFAIQRDAEHYAPVTKSGNQ